MYLTEEILETIVRLGGEMTDSPERELLLEGEILPDSLNEFLCNVSWPEEMEYGFKPQIDVDQDSDAFDWDYHEQCMIIRYVDFAYEPLEFLTELHIGDIAENRRLMMIGIADGGNYLLTVSLDDEDPSDPMVLVFEHDVYSEEDFLPEEIRLSKFLAHLIPQDDVDHLEEDFDIQY